MRGGSRASFSLNEQAVKIATQLTSANGFEPVGSLSAREAVLIAAQRVQDIIGR
jgi:hypothetical protein